MPPFGPSFPSQLVVYFRNQPSFPSRAQRNADISPSRAIFLASLHSTLATSHCPVFSYSYESLFPQPLFLDSDLSCPGAWGAGFQFSTLCLCASMANPMFSAVCSLFALSLRSFPHNFPLFSITCSLFFENTRVGGTSTLPRQAALPPSYAPRGVSPPSDLNRLRILPLTTGVTCKNTEPATLTTFRMNTCKSVSKQRTLTAFRINTCEKQGGGGLELYTVSRPTSPACLESGLPIHTTLHRTALSGSSSRISSTACPRLSRKFPCSRNPRSDASTTRQGILVWFRSRLMTRLARFFAAIRLRFLGWRGFLASGGGGGWLAGLFCGGEWIWG